jgi:hypothetical protein
MNITREFVNFLATKGFGTFGTSIFIGGVPQEAPDASMWVLSGGGTPSVKNETNNMRKKYVFNVYYRNKDAEDVYETLQELEELINSDACTQLGSYETLDMECTLFPTDQDLDIEDRTVGLLEVTATVYA